LARNGTGDESSPLSSPVTDCKGVGPKTAEALLRLGIATIGHLLHHLPRGYLDRRDVRPIASIKTAGPAVVRGKITRMRSYRRSRRFHITQCVIRDDTGSLDVVWFNQPYMGRALPKGAEAVLSGTVSDRRGLQMVNPDVEPLSDGEPAFLHTLGLIPLYPLTRGLGQKKLRRLIHSALDEFVDRIPENLPRRLIEGEALLSRREALREIHFPTDDAKPDAARNRIAFEEFLALQLSIQASLAREEDAGIAHTAPSDLTVALQVALPFELTSAQRRAIDRIGLLMESPRPMNALLQGDVGCGKTMVAVFALLKALENGRQAIMMAPTEILAEQHASGISERVGTLSRTGQINVALLTGGRLGAEREHALETLRSGEPAIVVGTHALIGQNVDMKNAGLIVIDEQHRFGVNQRATLKDKGADADLLIMTATPIPRTLALALYGNFETVVIDEYPPGRHPVETEHVVESERERMYRLIEAEVEKGRQAFVVCPEIDPRAESGDRPIADVKRVFGEYAKRFSDFSVGVLHGRVPPEEREAVLRSFRSGQTKILVSTTIIEVGVDVPNATAMVIENADRFGLAQLHQLRGRVGRAGHKSYCFLVAEPTTEEAYKRIEIMTSTNDGFKIAEEDLLLRGPGEFLGYMQSGALRLRAGHLIRDGDLLARAREIASEILEGDPRLESPENEPLRELLGGARAKVHY